VATPSRNLPSADQAKLTALGIEVMIPDYLPAGFAFASVTIENNEYQGKKNPDYRLCYCNRQKQCFWIESAYGEIGDGPDSNTSIRGSSPLFGEFTIDLFQPHTEGNDGAEPYVLSSWMPNETMRKDSAAHVWPSTGRYYHVRGTGLTLEEAARIIKSFRILK
jgi:hypothetical protein